MKKVININTSIFELVKNYPEVTAIMASLGFTDITNPLTLNSVGRIMSIKKGALMKKIDLDLIKKRFGEHDFTLEE